MIENEPLSPLPKNLGNIMKDNTRKNPADFKNIPNEYASD